MPETRRSANCAGSISMLPPAGCASTVKRRSRQDGPQPTDILMVQRGSPEDADSSSASSQPTDYLGSCPSPQPSPRERQGCRGKMFSHSQEAFLFVLRGLVPRIHVFVSAGPRQGWGDGDP